MKKKIFLDIFSNLLNQNIFIFYLIKMIKIFIVIK